MLQGPSERQWVLGPPASLGPWSWVGVADTRRPALRSVGAGRCSGVGSGQLAFAPPHSYPTPPTFLPAEVGGNSSLFPLLPS